MDEDGITLEEIGEATGVEKRTLRSWIAQGLLAPPLQAGRNARYPESNLDRAWAVLALRDLHGLQLSEIRQRLMKAEEGQIRAWAAEALPRRPAEGSKAVDRPPVSSARDYLAGIGRKAGSRPAGGEEDILPSFRGKGDEDPLPQASFSFSARAPGRGERAWDDEDDDPIRAKRERRERLLREREGFPGKRPYGKPGPGNLSGIEALLAVLEQAVRVSPGRRARGDDWYRIEITPDIELTVRGQLSPRERALLERIADLIRAILTGGTHDE